MPLLLALLGLVFSSALFAAEGEAVVGSTAIQPSEYFGEIMVSLVLVLLVIFLSAWVLRRYSRFPGVADGHLRVIGAISVGQREKILLLQVGKEQLLVGVTSSKISRLHQLEDLVEVKDNAPIASQFSQRLQEALKSKEQTPNNRADN